MNKLSPNARNKLSTTAKVLIPVVDLFEKFANEIDVTLNSVGCHPDDSDRYLVWLNIRVSPMDVRLSYDFADDKPFRTPNTMWQIGVHNYCNHLYIDQFKFWPLNKKSRPLTNPFPNTYESGIVCSGRGGIQIDHKISQRFTDDPDLPKMVFSYILQIPSMYWHSRFNNDVATETPAIDQWTSQHLGFKNVSYRRGSVQLLDRLADLDSVNYNKLEPLYNLFNAFKTKDQKPRKIKRDLEKLVRLSKDQHERTC